MKLNIRGKNLSVTPAIKESIEKKLNKLDKYFKDGDNTTSNVIIKTRANKDVIEVTILKDSTVIRAEVMDDDLYTAIDLVVEKLERQIRKHKTKLNNRIKKNIIQNFDIDLEDDLEEENSKIIKRKEIDMKPMDEEEAILQMNMLGHSFFVFKNSSNGLICVLYLRKNGTYGIIEAK